MSKSVRSVVKRSVRGFGCATVSVGGGGFGKRFLTRSIRSLEVRLSERSLFLMGTAPRSRGTPSTFFSMDNGMGTDRLATFSHRFTVVVGSNISVMRALSVLGSRSFSSFFGGILLRICSSIGMNFLLSRTVRGRPGTFPRFFMDVTCINRRDNALSRILVSYTSCCRDGRGVGHGTADTVICPMFLLVLVVTVIYVVMVFMVPAFRSTLSRVSIRVPRVAIFVVSVDS